MQLFGLKDGVHKRWCRFIIHRYLGQLLEQSLELDQLSVELSAGKLAVNEVKINTEYVNDFLASRNVPVTLTDGFVGRITIGAILSLRNYPSQRDLGSHSWVSAILQHQLLRPQFGWTGPSRLEEVPWLLLLSEPCKISLHQLELTLQLERDSRPGSELELSLLGSIVNSFPSSEDLARSFYEDVKQAHPNADAVTKDGVKAVAEIIDAIISRVVVELTETNLRLESATKSNPHLRTAVEVRLKNIHYMDGIHGKDGGSVNTSTPSHKRETVDRKCLDMSGVEFFTDVSTATGDRLTDQNPCCEDEQTLIYSSVISHNSVSTDRCISSSSSTVNFHSCYSTSDAYDRVNQTVGSRCPGLEDRGEKLMSRPVKFAELVGESHMTFCTRMSDVSVNEKDKKLEVELLCQSFHCFISPSQIEILKRLFSSLAFFQNRSHSCGRKMRESDYDVMTKNVERTMQRECLTATVREEMGKEREDFQKFVSINLDDSSRKFSSIHNTFEAENAAEASISLKVKLETVLMYIPHNDDLSLEYVKSLADGYHEALDQISKEAETFFTKSAAISLRHCTLTTARSMLDDLHPKDHLRVVGSSIVFDYQTGNADSGFLRAKVLFASVDVIEFLTAESNPIDGKDEHIPLLDFSDIAVHDPEPQLKIFFETASDMIDKPSIIIYIGRCLCELDPSIVDRIADLLAPRPFFDYLLDRPSRSRVTVGTEFQQLCEDHLNSSTNQQTKESKLTVKCAAFKLRLRIPMIDLSRSAEAKTAFRQRHVYPEYIILLLNSLVAEIMFGDETATLEMYAAEIHGSLCGISNELAHCQEDYQFLCMGQRVNEPLHIKLDYDPRNKALSCDTEMCCAPGTGIIDALNDSLSSPVIKSVPHRKGPFVHAHRSFFQNGQKENLVIAGSREEMRAFGTECTLHSTLVITMNIPLLRVLISSCTSVELLYSRIVNGLLLWQPAARPSASDTEDLIVNVLSDVMMNVRKHGGKSKERVGSLEEEPEPLVSSDVFERSKPHLLSLTLDLGRASLMCIAEEKEGDDKGLSANVTDAQFFFVGGYHGKTGVSYAYFTTHAFAVEDRKVDTVPRAVSSEFDEWNTDETHVCTIPADDEFSSQRNGDALGIAVRLCELPDQDTKGVLLAVALRNLCLRFRILRNLEETWVSRLAHLFNSQNYSSTGTEPPAMKTELHTHLDNVVLAYDHTTKSDNTVRLRLVLDEADISSSIAQDDAFKITSVFEDAAVFMSNIRKPSDNIPEEQNGYNCANQKEYSKVVDIGLLQFECSYTCSHVESEETSFLEIRGLIGTTKVRICADTLATMLNIATEICEFHGYFAYANNEFFAPHSANTHDVMKNYCNGSHSNLAKKSQRRVLVSAMKESAAHDCQYNASAARSDQFADSSLDLLWTGRTRAYPQDDEFCVLDTVGAGNINSTSKPYIKYIGSQARTNFEIDIDYQHFCTPESFDECAALLSSSSTPTVRFLFRDMSISLHLCAGPVQGENLLKNCSSFSGHRERLNNQTVNGDEHGGNSCNYPTCLALQLSKITYVYQLFGEKSPFKSKMFLSIDDMTLLDMLSASKFKKVMYQYSSAQQPRRTCAPMLAVRMTESHSCEGKMRVAMLPVKFNFDQDTVDFVNDFLQEVTESTVDTECKLKTGSGQDTTFFKEFIFSPPVPIYVDYHGKNRVNMEKDGAVVGVLTGFGHLRHAEFVLNEIVYRNGYLGVSRCFNAAVEEWLSNIKVFPNVLASFGPIRPIYQIGKAVVDLFLFPAAELRKQDGHLIKGIQKGFGSFGQSSTAGVVGMAQALVGVVQALAEPAFQKLQP